MNCGPKPPAGERPRLQSWVTYVGNSIVSDVAGAHAAGSIAVHVPHGLQDGVDVPEAHYRLESLEELVSPPRE
jgi:FMN phosphatase YigB (HAD superfamily)